MTQQKKTQLAIDSSSRALDAETEGLLQEDSKSLLLVLDAMEKIVVGQTSMCRGLLMGLIADGHVLIEGFPGLAKTLAVKTLAQLLDARFQRIQFTPDLLPSDLIGTMIYHQATGEFVTKKGPIFTNILLADEINRAPAKVQSALLEAMAEKQVTVGEQSHPLHAPFLCLATQNPLEHEGTFPLPEAQLDRFMFKLKVGYPSRNEERSLLDRVSVDFQTPSVQLPAHRLLETRMRLSSIYVDERIKEYLLRLVVATRRGQSLSEAESFPDRVREIQNWIELGASPRALIYFVAAARASALLDGRTYVLPDDIKGVAHDILRHRLVLTYEAADRNYSVDDVIHRLLDSIKVP